MTTVIICFLWFITGAGVTTLIMRGRGFGDKGNLRPHDYLKAVDEAFKTLKAEQEEFNMLQCIRKCKDRRTPSELVRHEIIAIGTKALKESHAEKVKKLNEEEPTH